MMLGARGRSALVMLVFLGAAACDDGGAVAIDAAPRPDAPVPGFVGPDEYCPGQDHCTGQGGPAQLEVGVGAQVFTPTITETWTDENANSEHDPGEPYVDANGNGKFDPYWLFGGVPAGGQKTELSARALAFRQHDTVVVICYLDTIGLLAEDMDLIRGDAQLVALGVDHVVVGATHAHSTPDTVGISNQNPLESGYDPLYVATVRAAAVAAIAEAVASMQPARMRIASTRVLDDPDDPQSGTDQFAKDIRDPVIYDPTLTIARFVLDADPETTIATFVNWADHPEVALYADSPENLLISAHYPHWLRRTIEDGVAAQALPGLGGTAVFVQGALGGQIGTLRGTAPIGLDGLPVTMFGHAMDQALGESVAVRALAALADRGVDYTDLPLSYRTTEYPARIDNIGFQTFFLLGVLAPHRLYGYDPDEPISDSNTPWLPLRATYVQIGPLGIVTAPGELHPELWVGVHQDGSWSWGYPLYDETKPNLPQWELAAEPPYLRDLVLANQGVVYPVLAGQAEDYVGYIVPAYNYVLDPSSPYLSEAEGDHYEEVYSLGPDNEAHIVNPILELVKWRAP